MNKVVFTNGCFDIIHAGHIDLLDRAKMLGDYLIVGINSDESVRKIKGNDRPFTNEVERKTVLLGLKAVNEVHIFDELTPEELIKQIKPNILVKGGDWKKSEIIGVDFVEETGGKVFSLPLKEGFSSSRIVDKIRNQNASGDNRLIDNFEKNPARLINYSLEQHNQVFREILQNQISVIEECGEILFETLTSGNKLLLCGNGGSAADAQHLAAEFVGRYETERRGFPAIALTTDTSALTALANDYNFEKVFARQVEALASEGDCLIAISTSGKSPNVIEAVMKARSLKCRVIGLTGAKGKKLASLSDACVLIPSERTARIQEAHITIGHIWCEIFDNKIASISKNNN